jgi:HK97 family phage portal protein
MGLFDRFKKAKTPTIIDNQNTRLKLGWSNAARRNASDWLRAFHESPRMNSVALIASDVARAEFKLFDKEQYKKDKDNAKPIEVHPFLEMVDDPCPTMAGVDWYLTMYMITASRLTVGEAFALLERDKGGRPRQMYYIPVTWVLSTPTSTEPFYRVAPSGNVSSETINVPAYDMLYWKEANLYSPYDRGRGRAERIGTEIESDDFAAAWAKNSFYNSARPEILVSMKGGDQSAAERLKEAWYEKFGGPRNAGGAAFTGAELQIHNITTSPKDMDFIESRRYLKGVTREEFAIPPELFGDISNSNRSTIDSADYLYSKNVLTRELDRTASVFNQQLMWQYDDNLIFVYDNVVPDDVITKIGQAKEAYQFNAITKNEYRKVLGFAPVQGGDVFKPEYAPVINNSLPEVKSCGCIEHSSVDVKKNYTQERLSRFWKIADSAAVSTEAQYISAAKAWSAEQQKAFTAAYKKLLKDGIPMSSAVDMALEQVFGAYADQAVKKGFTPAWVSSMKKGAEIAQEVLGAAINWELLNPEFLQWIETNGLLKAKYINDTTKEMLRLSLTDGIAQGESIKKLSDRINEVYKTLNGDEMERYRAERIARTEAIGSVNNGQYHTYLSEGVQTLMWIATSDSDTREEHAAVNGVMYPANQGINVGGEVLMYPGDPNGSPWNIIQCRCTVIAVTDGM